ncbi:metal ABC transporter permease [Vibrio splendidus]|uniref:metal ABC transporter permease n=1 Tax=Vibrio splendidus TaxID=29497 RepID=UPI003D11550E
MIIHALFDPFIQFGFMRRALMSCIALSLSSIPLGIFLQLRRMSLVGDALSHAILPGVALGYLMSGMSLVAMGLGGFVMGLVVAIISSIITHRTKLHEDASFAGFYLGSLALGVTLISLKGSSVDLLHLLFGSILAVNNASLLFIACISTFTLIAVALLYRALVIGTFDPTFLMVNRRAYPILVHGLFLALLVLNLVAGFQILGTLMSVGLMMLPAVSAHCWMKTLSGTIICAVLIGISCAWLGLCWSYYASLPAGPAIVLTASIVFFCSLLFSDRARLLRDIFLPFISKHSCTKENK